MEPRILASVAIVGVASATAGIGLFAFFSDTATSSSNLFSAGTVDLKVNNADSIGMFIGGSNMKPGDTFSGNVTLKNNGSITTGLDLDIAIAISQNNGTDGVGNISKFLRIQNLDYGGTPITISDVNGNGFSDLGDWDVSNTNTTDLADPGAGGRILNLTVVFDTSAGNDLQGDSATVTFTFFLAQVAAPDQPA